MYKTQSRNLQRAASKIDNSKSTKRTNRGSGKVSMSAVGGQILEIGSIVAGNVKKILDCGVIISFDSVDGMIHVSEISDCFVQHPSEYFKIGDTVRAVVIGVDFGKNRVNLSFKRFVDEDRRKWQACTEKEYLEWYAETLKK